MSKEQDEAMDALKDATNDAACKIIDHFNTKYPGLETVVIISVQDRQKKLMVMRAACFSDYQDEAMLKLCDQTTHLAAGVFSGLIETEMGPFLSHKKSMEMH